jgi:hypothetical protein
VVSVHTEALEPGPPRGPVGRSLVKPQAADEQHQVGVGAHDEADGVHVMPRMVQRHAEVEGDKADHRSR